MATSIMRRRFVSKNPAQTKFLLILLISILVPAFFVGGALYSLIFKILSEQQTSLESIGYNLYPVIMKTNLGIAFGFVPLFLLLLTWGVILTHRFFGPLERLQREIDSITQSGNFKTRIGVRQHDYVKPLVESINKLLCKISETPQK